MASSLECGRRDIDQRVAKLKKDPNVTSEPAPDGSGRSTLGITAEKARAGDPGAKGELEAIERHSANGSKVKVRSESNNPNQTSPDLEVDNKLTEVKTRSEPLGDNSISKLVTDSNKQVKNSGQPGPGQADIQLKGDVAKSPPNNADLNREVRRSFNDQRGRSLDKVTVLSEGEPIGVWERNPATGEVTQTFSKFP